MLVRKLMLACGVIGFVALGATPAVAQCNTFVGAPCLIPARPRISADFGARQLSAPSTVQTPARTPRLPQVPQSGRLLQVAPGQKPVIDCEMVRPADPNIDPKIVRDATPPPGVKYFLRVIPVTPCPRK